MQRYKLTMLSVGFLAFAVSANAEVAQEPLFLGGGNVPGNLAIVPSVEFPTVNSVANLDSSYNPDKAYIGYFDSNKCYDYEGSNTESERHFYPVTVTNNMRCPGPVWSGNYLNWATTQTIDPFRWALTGGLRVKDTPTETWVEKARHDGQGSYFPQRTVSGSSLVADVTPFSADWVRTDIDGLDKQMRFELPGDATLQAGGGDAPTTRVVFEDSGAGNGNNLAYWTDYRSGDLDRNRDSDGYRSAPASIEKDNNNDPDGGYASIGETLNTRTFTLHGWFRYEGGGGSLVRLAVSDNNADGYGFSIGPNDIRVEKRNNGGASNMGGSAGWNRSDDTWYRFEFIGQADNRFELKVYSESGNLLQSVTSSSDSSYSDFSRIYIHGGHRFYIDDLRLEVTEGGGGAGNWPYVDQGSNHYDAAVRVKVCDDSVGVEANCVQYSQGWKPEGLMQEYSDRIRYSVFGYLNDSDKGRDGGVLRASQKFIGLRARDPNSGWGVNSAAEWSEVTGQQVRNPDSSAASSTASYFGITVEDSGAMNYINKFGELNSNNFKSNDPVSELYYTATRYFRGLSAVPEYSTRSPAHDSNPSSSTKARWVDGFPVVRSWDDPIQYSCQKNVILGIGDVYTHNDQNLPGRTGTSGEPSRPSAVSSDNEVDVEALNAAVGALEGMNLNDEGRFGSTRNAGYMIGLAFDARTRDIRDDIDGKQTIKTYWVDVLENQRLEGIGRNQYWLTAKYGGFEPRCPANNANCTLPEIDGPYDGDIPDPLPENWWFTNGEVLTQSNANLKRTDNYYPAGQADTMVDGLKKAFADIAANLKSTATSLSFNSSRLKTGSLLYQALLDTTYWSGDLQGSVIASDATVADTPSWSAADKLDALNAAALATRKIVTGSDLASDGDGGMQTGGGRAFLWSSLTASQQSALEKDDENGAVVNSSTAERRLEYLRGNRSHEQTYNMRARGSRLGDIVNSDPQYIHHDNFGYAALSSENGFTDAIGDAYTSYRTSANYQNKTPVVVAGANDGMFHIFDAADDGGDELFAYVPVSIFDQLYKLTKPDYIHQYYVDGTARLGDAWLGDVTGWRTLAVATTGAGGSGVFALDITEPELMSATSLLWEYSNPKMGLLVQQPSLVALATGRFGVVVTSGYDAPQSEGYVWILDAEDGSLIKEFELPSGELGAPLVIDLERDRVADRIYVGDTEGNIWRLDIEGSNVNQWGAIGDLKQGNTVLPLYTALDPAGNPQPITAPLTAAYSETDDPMLFFGTGSYHQVNDISVGQSPQVQTFYGIIDKSESSSGRGDLTMQEIQLETQTGDFAARVVSQNTPLSDSDGWYLDLQWAAANGGPGPNGERVVSEASFAGHQVVFSTLIPSSDPCEAGGDSWIMALNMYHGGRGDDFFDYNQDGVVDGNDSVTITVQDEEGNDVEVEVPGSGIKEEPSNGIIKSPSVLTADDGTRYVCYAGSGDTEKRCVLVQGSMEQGRQSWREIIPN
ncbi:pilus assembly protein [Marinobacterium litorale]|uniref:pilus assembly protein n=1 Tax=Marinobacterium litorale TaxID=404770 RepID=UPI00040B4C53|nr:PilC/PilY family type IV pilus protein [Marinobacterium litorale]